MRELTLSGRPGIGRIDRERLRRLIRVLIEDLLGRDQYELGVRLVTGDEMEGLNRRFLNHAGPTDVLSFAYGNPSSEAGLQGDVVICVEEAVRQSRQHDSTWQAELVRYVVHGVLHLVGYLDGTPAERRVMKREEERLVGQLARRFPLSKLGGKSRLNA